ncbi:hypothetical protein CF15_06945 [Pyrodictium occultum]|uniref:Uncharacterized protein n=1 Tax=Pyrodictium occultum TaxID=2309 RepID=A0A0V8RWL5_PYROC|nr:hypothetical protein [Pyrodictium occultum]KSW12455.1 hypothetical protein CF15_06945 [Pyrodictium occultum]
MNHRSAALALAALAASAAALALLAGFATTQSPLSSFYAVGCAQAPNEPISLQQLGSITIAPASGAEGSLEEPEWLKITRHSDVDYVKLELSLENADQLRRLLDYLSIEVREAYQVFEGNVTTDQPYCKRAPQDEWPHLSWAIDGHGKDIAEKLKHVLRGHVQKGIDVDAAVQDILSRVSYATITLAYRNYTYNGTLYLAPGNGTAINETLHEIARHLVRGSGIVVHTPYADGRGFHHVVIEADTQPPTLFFDSADYGIIVGNGTSGHRPASALNFTLRLDFYDSSGNWLFAIWWDTIYYSYAGGRFNNWASYEYLSVARPVLKLGNVRAVLSLGKPSAVVAVDGDSWLYDGGRAAVLGARVYYEAREGVLFDSVPLVINARVVETG